MVEFTTEDFECPICLEIPLKEVYQCKNGHIMCDGCIPKVIKCPQCCVPLSSTNRCRNRFMESMLDRLPLLNCPYSERGCKAKLERKLIETHKKSCEYGVSLNICKLLGHFNCDFMLHFANAEETVEHLTTFHITNYVVGGPEPNLVSLMMSDFCQIVNFEGVASATWSFILRVGDDSIEKSTFLIVCKVDGKFLSLACLDMNMNNLDVLSSRAATADSVDMALRLPTKKGAPATVKCYLPIVNGLDSNSKKYLEDPPLKISIPYLMQRCDGVRVGVLWMDIQMQNPTGRVHSASVASNPVEIEIPPIITHIDPYIAPAAL